MLVQITDDDTGDLVDLTNANIVFEVREQYQPSYDDIPRNCYSGSATPALSASTDNGKVVIVDLGVFQVSFTAEEMRQLRASTYNVGCTISNDDSEPQQIIIGTVPILDGVVS